MPDRRVVIVAPTVAEARGEADELGIPHAQQIIAANGHTQGLRGRSLTEEQLVRVREDGWSDGLCDAVDFALHVGARNAEARP